MNADEVVAVGTFASRIDAEVALGALAGAEIEGIVSGDDAGGMRPHLAVGGYHVLVRASDAERAAAVIAAASER